MMESIVLTSLEPKQPVLATEGNFAALTGYWDADVCGKDLWSLIGSQIIIDDPTALHAMALEFDMQPCQVLAATKFLVQQISRCFSLVLAREQCGLFFVCEVISRADESRPARFKMLALRDVTSEVSVKSLLLAATPEAYPMLLAARSGSESRRQQALDDPRVRETVQDMVDKAWISELRSLIDAKAPGKPQRDDSSRCSASKSLASCSTATGVSLQSIASPRDLRFEDLLEDTDRQELPPLEDMTLEDVVRTLRQGEQFRRFPAALVISSAERPLFCSDAFKELHSLSLTGSTMCRCEVQMKPATIEGHPVFMFIHLPDPGGCRHFQQLDALMAETFVYLAPMERQSAV